MALAIMLPPQVLCGMKPGSLPEKPRWQDEQAIGSSMPQFRPGCVPCGVKSMAKAAFDRKRQASMAASLVANFTEETIFPNNAFT
ncbi:MAG: hypothetical protein E6Q43_03935 [Dokdonella sp.]|nr:MAG: hypothetical protein E6Q43_03935 [Dokdonella sp.]